MRRSGAGAATLLLVAACTDAPLLTFPSDAGLCDAEARAREPEAGGTNDGGTKDGGGADSSGPLGTDSSLADACSPQGPLNPVALENTKPGTVAWKLDKPASNHEIEGYASTTSALPGDSVTLQVSTDTRHAASWELYRLGYYAGLGGRLQAHGGPITVSTQPSCPIDPTTGMVECLWEPTFTLDLRSDLVTGQYLIKLVRDDGFQSYVPLVVREPDPRAPLLVESNVTTWEAYNTWGGSSLYKNLLPASVGFTAAHAYRVSFDRPYESIGDEGPMRLSETAMLRWLEMKGYDVAYSTPVDLAGPSHLLDSRKLFVVAGHDEYWTVAERDAVEAARDQGVSLAFFAANTGYWRIRIDPSTGGTPSRIITCYKDARIDPLGTTPEATARFREEPFPRPENGLSGAGYVAYTRMDSFLMIVTNPTHWVYEGTSVAFGDPLSHIVGEEWDAVRGNSVSPASLEVLAHSNAISREASAVASDMTVYYPTASSIVFSTGTINWAYGLLVPGYRSPRVQRVTENVLARAGVPTKTPTEVPRERVTDIGSASKVTVIAGSTEAGYLDGPGASAKFNEPVGIAVDADGVLYVTETGNQRVRRIATDGTVSTLAGGGSRAFREGTGVAAAFNLPTGIAVGPDGRIYVGDAGNARIRAITPEGVVTTFAGNGVSASTDASNPLSASFMSPRGLAFAPDGSLYVADSYATNLRRVAADGVTTVALDSQEWSGVAVAPDGTVYAVSQSGFVVSVLKAGALIPIAGGQDDPGDLLGRGTRARLRPADGLIVDNGSLVVTDTGNYKVRRIALSPDYTVTTLAGDGRAGSETGTDATLHLVAPRGIVRTRSGYAVTDSGNNRILRIEP